MQRRTEFALALVALLLVACERSDNEYVETESATIEADTPAVGDLDTATARDSAASRPRDETGATTRATTVALRTALDRLVSGATADSATWFSAQTADIIRSVDVDANGRAVVDFVDLRPLIPNASSSAGSQMLLDQLNATVFGVDGVTSVEYRMAGSCELLGEWLQYGVCLRFP